MSKRNLADRQSKYKNVHSFTGTCRGKGSTYLYWKASLTRNGKRILNKLYENEAEAAKAVDWVLINLGEKPVNGFYTPVKK